MRTDKPLVSVVIPAYNQAGYLSDAVRSALGQTLRDREIIVVDDGSTDETRSVAEGFGGAVRYLWQQNRGLAGARNTGIRHARGEYVALLDSDDEWDPDFLATMMSVAAQEPNSAAYYSGWRYVDAQGAELPQAPCTRVVEPDALYHVLLQANFIVPSAVMLRRPAVEGAGLFDETFRRLEDLDLWLRMLKGGQRFVGSAVPLVRYRLHGSSLSADWHEMHQSLLAVIAKIFGPDDGRSENWSDDRRKAHASGHRYGAIMSVVRGGDWNESSAHLHRAFQIDPSLILDIDLYYELALGRQPIGYRGTRVDLNLEENAERLLTGVRNVFLRPPLDRYVQLEREAYGSACYALGLAAYHTGQFARSRHLLLDAVRFRGSLWRDGRFVNALVRSVAGRYLRKPALDRRSDRAPGRAPRNADGEMGP